MSIPLLMFGSGVSNIGGSIFGGLFGASAERKRAAAIREAGATGAESILRAGRQANARSSAMLDTARGDLSPFRGYGVQAGNSLMDILFGGGSVVDLLKESPLFQFQSDLGSRNINRQLASRGLYGSGAGLETLARFNNQLVGEEGQRMFDRLFGVTQLGQGAATTMAGLTNQTGLAQAGTLYQSGSDAANMIYNSTVGAANANANATHTLGQMGQSIFNDIGKGLMQYGNYATYKPLLDSQVASNYGMTGGTSPQVKG